MNRRSLLRTFAVLGLASPLVAASSNTPELLYLRQAVFEEVGDSVLLSVALPELLSVRDADAMDSIDSAFTTTLAFRIYVYRTGSNDVIAQCTRVVKIQWNPWKECYTTQIADEGKGVSIRFFTDRTQAVRHATHLERVKIANVSALTKGSETTYFVVVVGQRNPLDPQAVPSSGPDLPLQHQNRDLSVFSRWIGIFIRTIPRAEKTFAIRTSPAFYLVER